MTDHIEREIQIDAPIEQVFALVSEPGWWIEDGDPADRVVTREGDVTVVELPQHGRFPVLPVASDPPHSVSFRGGAPGQAATDGTLVEFLLVQRDGGTLLRVVESDLARMAAPYDVEGNTEGWGIELTAAKERAERIAA